MKTFLRNSLFLFFVVTFAVSARAADLDTIKLPAPDMDGGRPLMQVLADRSTSREFSGKPLPEQTLSNLLWAAFGINRENGKRTAPSALNWQEIDLYVFMREGVYVYDAKNHELDPVKSGDLRAKTGVQDFADDAPVTVVMIADRAKMTGMISEEQKIAYSAADAAFISQNMYLYCASESLATGVRAYIDKPSLAKAINLRDDQMIILAQSVGYHVE